MERESAQVHPARCHALFHRPLFPSSAAGIRSAIGPRLLGQGTQQRNPDGTIKIRCSRRFCVQGRGRLDQHKKNFVVLDRDRLSEALKQAHLVPKDLTNMDSLQRVGNSLLVDAIVTGTLETNPNQCVLNITVHNAKYGTSLVSSEKSLPMSSFPDHLPPALSNQPGGEIPMAGKLGISTPTCDYCPYPAYTNEARKNKIQGVVVLLVTVTLEGRVGNIRLVKSPDQSLSEKAIEAVKEWRFKPATKDGVPLTVMVPIEVGFHLYR